jgi:hypothetical protein
MLFPCFSLCKKYETFHTFHVSLQNDTKNYKVCTLKDLVTLINVLPPLKQRAFSRSNIQHDDLHGFSNIAELKPKGPEFESRLSHGFFPRKRGLGHWSDKPTLPTKQNLSISNPERVGWGTQYQVKRTYIVIDSDCIYSFGKKNFFFVHFIALNLIKSNLGALVAQWLALLTSDLEGPGSNPG